MQPIFTPSPYKPHVAPYYELKFKGSIHCAGGDFLPSSFVLFACALGIVDRLSRDIAFKRRDEDACNELLRGTVREIQNIASHCCLDDLVMTLSISSMMRAGKQCQLMPHTR